MPDLSETYRSYIACLNAQAWHDLGDFVAAEACHNGQNLVLAGYRAMLERDFLAIPDLHFTIDLLIAEPPNIAARLSFNCSPKADFLGLPINGRTISFCENVFYRFEDNRIVEVWSVLDKTAIEAQLSKPAGP